MSPKNFDRLQAAIRVFVGLTVAALLWLGWKTGGFHWLGGPR